MTFWLVVGWAFGTLVAYLLWRAGFRAGVIYAARRMHEMNHPAGNWNGRWSPTARDIANAILKEHGAFDFDDDEDEDDEEDDEDETDGDS